MTYAIGSSEKSRHPGRRMNPKQLLRTDLGRQGSDVAANVGLLGALWFGYAAVRNAAGNTRFAALDNAARLLDVEETLGLDIEAAIQSAVDWPQAAIAANSYYLLHFPLTLAVMVVAFCRSRGGVFVAMRNSVIGCTAVALAVHTLLPMAPPRMLPGFVDTGVIHGPDPYALAGSGHANQFAAMPSMHVAWAIVCGFAIWQLSNGGAAKVVAVLHPLLTSFVVILTGHHFVFDVAIGAALALVALAVMGQLAPRSGTVDESLDVAHIEPVRV